jgi:hypothetical protein
MILWLDAQLSPRLARWLNATFAVVASPVRDLRCESERLPPSRLRRGEQNVSMREPTPEIL